MIYLHIFNELSLWYFYIKRIFWKVKISAFLFNILIIIVKIFKYLNFMSKSVETTVIVELFSTFFDKLTANHPEKSMLNNSLSDFKNFLYSTVFILK
jgi:hypothetical protein